MNKPKFFVVEYDTDDDVYESAFAENLENAVTAADTFREEAVEDGFDDRTVIIYELKEVEI